MNNMIRQATLDRANRKKDKSVSISFTTDLEQTSDEFMEIDQIIGTRGIIYFKSSGELTQEEINAIDSTEIELEGKSKSQKLRNTIYLNWKQSDQNKTKEQFYTDEMNKITEHYINKLD